MDSTVEMIERAIDIRTPQQREQLAFWFDEHHPPQLIDAQLEADLHATPNLSKRP